MRCARSQHLRVDDVALSKSLNFSYNIEFVYAAGTHF